MFVLVYSVNIPECISDNWPKEQLYFFVKFVGNAKYSLRYLYVMLHQEVFIHTTKNLDSNVKKRT